MKKIFLSILTAVLLSHPASALQVDTDELKSARKIEFINYTGNVRHADSPREVFSIGKGLAASLAKRGSDTAAFSMKYSIVRALSKEEPDKYSADIFSINKDARVGHIDNVRRIIAGYLEGMYGYSPRNSRTLSLFITYYNALYRGDMNYISSKYKSIVVGHLDASNAGISTRYDEWPGATRILIPLTDNPSRGRLDSIDPDMISDDDVRKEIRKDDKNIEDRKDLVELKKKVIEKNKDEINREKTELSEKEKKMQKDEIKLKEREKTAEKEKSDLQKEKESITKEKGKAAALLNPEEKKKKEKEIQDNGENIKKREEKSREEEKKISEEKKKIEKKKEETSLEKKKIKDKEEKLTKKEDKISKEEKEIRDDEIKRDIKKSPDKVAALLSKKAEELDQREDALRDKKSDKNIYALKLFYLKIREYLQDGHYNNEMYMINAATRSVEFKSPVENICGSRYDIFSRGVAVITHMGSHEKSHHLTLLSRETLQPVASGSDDIFWRSFVGIRDGSIYAIMIDKGEYYLGRFSEDLKLAAKSAERISKETFISFYEDFIYINRWDKKIMVLKKSDLSLVDIIAPEASGKK